AHQRLGQRLHPHGLVREGIRAHYLLLVHEPQPFHAPLHRVTVQVIGMISIFVTAFWGMLQNFNISILPG
ncbi:MAG: hypothetical protein H5U18_01300, partial [Rhodobacteraceae bacterium]|nr:hypothetical protein [Paracoccaceae bacterium]